MSIDGQNVIFNHRIKSSNKDVPESDRVLSYPRRYSPELCPLKELRYLRSSQVGEKVRIGR
jgi:hypothetical protein